MDHIAGNAEQLPGDGRRSIGQVVLRHQDGVRGNISAGLLWAGLCHGESDALHLMVPSP
ncbi:hypothetical protein [Bradyrhizobium glycinis]|uniref:hypothetical protein n=1 Tax=Bradyrhizobium glycinis TaxID=2751812 RepID=UPI0018D623C1|nr:hypothetical protein [Bradyrhizobium glycinis]MBH5371412.1 hypothetical protein [Bradyrhizobium glycinis]